MTSSGRLSEPVLRPPEASYRLTRPMRRPSALLLFSVLCALSVCALGAGAWPWRPGGDVLTEDQNHDGRPDVWRAYDHQGRLARIALDTNFDGRSDVQEFYE